MLNYRYVNETGIVNDYLVLEVTTDQIIHRGLQRSAAESLTRTLNRGKAFDGRTPPFFLNRIELNRCLYDKNKG